MRLKVVMAAVAAAVMSMALASTAAGATSGDEALWGASYVGSATGVEQCGSGGGARSVDSGGFCVIDDFGAVELGVKFRSDRALLVTGVRVYRVDSGSMTGSLWTADGVLEATGTFDPYSGQGWQDLHFSTPVAIAPDETYVASYSAPNADYAFELGFFSSQSVTVGPITALSSAEAGGNGVYCYVGQDCDRFPTYTYNDTNYWVSPLWSPYEFTGFRQPVDTGKLNVAKAGSAIPVKFGLGGDLGLAILRAGFPRATPIVCDSSASVDAVESTAAAGSSTLSYDPLSAQYVYTWKTSKSWANTCYRFDLGLLDGSVHTFDVAFVK
jgi:hypothetical protein